MKSLDEIRADLKDIRYYYRRKNVFDEAGGTVGVCGICEKVRAYNQAAKYASPRLYDVYVCLYIKNFTQEGLAAEMGYAVEHVQRMHKKLLLFLQKTVTD